MAAKPAADKNSAEGFIGSVFKYSISTFANVLILGLSMVLTGRFFPSDVLNQIDLFTRWTNTIMTIAILGLDQSLIRFFHEPPKGTTRGGLFRLCFYFSSGALLVAGAVCTAFFMRPIHSALGFSMVGQGVVPLLFLNAFFYMVARYFNVLYRMEGNILVYTTESILMQFFYKLFYVLGYFVWPQNPVPAMVVCSLLGLGAFALVFSFARRRVLTPKRGETGPHALKAILPYGLAMAPTAVMVTLNSSFSQSYLTGQLGETPAGHYGFAYTLSNIVTMIQGGFASFWGPYMFENYKTQQTRIKRVHNYLNLAVLCFFALLIAFEDILFWVFTQQREAQPIFPLMMLSAVFTILCETTVYGNAIAKRPIFDTIGIGVSFGTNVLGLLVLAPRFGLFGAAAALAIANGCMFLFRTFTGQRFYPSIATPGKTVAAVVVAVALGVAGTVFAGRFVLKGLCCLAGIIFYIMLYKEEFIRLVKMGVSIVKSIFGGAKT